MKTKKRAPGGGRKPLPESEHTVKMSFRMKPATADKIRALAERWGLSQADVIAHSVEWVAARKIELR